MNNPFYIFIPFIAFLAGFVLISFFVYEPPFKTPSLLGHSVTYALQQATQQGFMLKLLAERASTEVAPGTVLAQKPSPGALIRPKQVVLVTLSSSAQQAHVTDLRGMQEAEWRKQALCAQAHVKTCSVVHHMPSGMVIAQSPEPSVVRPTGNQTLELIVSAGPETRRIMPEVTGMDASEVQEFFENYGVTVSTFKEPYDRKRHAGYGPGCILAQKPLPGSWIDLKKPLLVQLVMASW